MTFKPINPPEASIKAVLAVPNGDFAKNLPTLVLSFLGAPEDLHEVCVMMIDGGAVDIEPSGNILLTLFSQEVEQKDDDEYGGDPIEINYLFQVEEDVVDQFFDDLHKIKKFNVIISAQNYYYSCTIDEESTGLLSSSFQNRFLH